MSTDNIPTDRDELRRVCFSKPHLRALIKKKLARHKPRRFLFSDQPGTPAAVLIPIFFKNDQAHLLFTLRADHLEHHKSQISFPGGKKDSADASLLETALRESQEEVGLNPEHVEILGRTDEFLTNTFFLVTPYIGMFEYPYPFKVNSGEIERLIEVPLTALLDETAFSVKPWKKNGQTWQVHYYTYQQDVIWGVTGFLVSNFLSIVFDLKRNLSPGLPL